MVFMKIYGMEELIHYWNKINASLSVKLCNADAVPLIAITATIFDRLSNLDLQRALEVVAYLLKE